MSKRTRWIVIVVGIVVVIGIVSAAVSSKKAKAPAKPQATAPAKTPVAPAGTTGKVQLDANGTATQEAFVGSDVIWTITVENGGTKDVQNLEANTNFGGMELISIEPVPVDQPIQDLQRFGPLKAGQSVTINYRLLAKKVGIAKGLATFAEKGDLNPEAVLKPQTIVR